MATVGGRTRCVKCGKEKATSKCGGCLQDYCYNDRERHRQELSQQLDEVEVNRDLVRQTLTEQTTKSQKHSWIQTIDQWERDSIDIVRQAAEEARQLLFQHITRYDINEMEMKLNKLTNQLRQSREENDFIETDLDQWKEELKQLSNELAKQSNITLRQESKPLVTKIYVDVPSGKYASYV
jgi:DNA repair exonuclease SbcCD ATPase subunit